MRLKPRHKTYAREVNRRIDQNAKQLQTRILHWITRAAQKEARKILAAYRQKGIVGVPRIRKAFDPLEQELLNILMEFGLKQINATGADTVSGYGGEWVLRPALYDTIFNSKSIKVQQIANTTREEVINSIRRIITDAQTEEPIPSTGEIARRISTTFLGANTEGQGGVPLGAPYPEGETVLPTWAQPTEGAIVYAMSPERASLIARTEACQNENTGIYEGMRQLDVDQIVWLHSGSANPGKRHHDWMNGKVIELGEVFEMPSGQSMRYPGDPDAPISETANCSCVVAPKRIAGIEV